MNINYKKFLDDLTLCKSEDAVRATFVNYAPFSSTLVELDGVDFYSEPILYEFKKDVRNLANDYGKTLAQAMTYIYKIKNGKIHSLNMPTHIALVDKNESVLVTLTDDLLQLLEDNFSWGCTPSSPDKDLVTAINSIQIVRQSFDFHKGQLQEFIDSLIAIPTSTTIKKLITKDNYEFVYTDWLNRIGKHITTHEKKGMFYIADVREDAVYNDKHGELTFHFTIEKFKIPVNDYIAFWNTYERPPIATVQDLILSNKDMFTPDIPRRTDGEFYTPDAIVKLGIDYLETAFPGFQDDENTYIWDPCCGSGNMEIPLKSYDRVFMSTKDAAETLQLNQLGILPGATIFQFDFLKDNYEKLPDELKAVISDKSKRIIIYMNPPYGEATAGISCGANKAGISLTKTKIEMVNINCGRAAGELFNQFLYRAKKLCPSAVISLFATLKYLNAPGSAIFRDKMFTYDFKGGFIFPGNLFAGVKGKFPISFAVWNPTINWSKPSCKFDVYDKELKQIESKTICDRRDYITKWFKRPVCKVDAAPLTSAVKLASKIVPQMQLYTSTNALGYASLAGSDVGNINKVAFMSGNATYSNGKGSAITPTNFEKLMVHVAVRQSIAPMWLNDRDQFQIPTCDLPKPGTLKVSGAPDDTNLPLDFISDCIVFNSFGGFNQSSRWDTTFEGKLYHIKNDFFPFSKSDVQKWAVGDLNITRELSKVSDETFVYKWLASKTLTTEAKAVMDAAKIVYEQFYKNLTNLDSTQFKLGFWNPGWFQIRNSMKTAKLCQKELATLDAAHKALKAKIIPQVYSLGFLDK